MPRSALHSCLLFLLAVVASTVALVQIGVIENVAYSVERGRLRAQRESGANEQSGVSVAAASRSVREFFSSTIRTAANGFDGFLRDDRGMLGVWVGRVDRPETRLHARASGWRSAHGAFIHEVMSGEAAERAGLQAGDIILAVNDHAITAPDDLVDLMERTTPGTRAVVEFWRRHRRYAAVLRIGSRPAS